MAESAQQYLGLVISDEWVSAAIWQQVDSKVTILSRSDIVSLENETESAINPAIDIALDSLGDAGLTLKNVLYILPHHWVKDNDLIEGKKRFLKSLSQDLVLEPLGFVVLTDTLVAHESTKHGLPFAGMIIADTIGFWDIALFENGEEKQLERIGKSGNLSQDIQELQARLANSKNPERIIFLSPPGRDTVELETELQETFHTPLETTSPEQIVEISLLTGGYEVLQSDEEAAHADSQTAGAHTDQADQNASLETSSPAQQAAARETSEDSPLMNAPPAGFTPPTFVPTVEQTASSTSDNSDNLVVPPPTGATEATPASNRPHFSQPTYAGRAEETNEPPPTTAVDGLTNDSESNPAENTSQNAKTRKQKFSFLAPFANFVSSFAGLKNAFSGKTGTAPLSTNSFLAVIRKQPLIWIGGGLLLLFLLIAGGTYAFFAQTYTAHIDIWLATEELEIEDTFIVGASAPSASVSALSATTFTEEASNNKEVATTGNKVIGDPATGRVKIYNKTEQEKLFLAGTEIRTGNLRFTLDEDVTIASASTEGNGPGSTTIKSGVAEVDVTAVDIGPEGNVAEDTLFTVANFASSSYEAQNDSAFTGGSEREIQAVAQKDIDTAVQDLTESATAELTDRIENNQEAGEYVLFTDEVEVTEINTSAEVGAEAQRTQVTVTVRGTALRITQDEIEATAQELLADQIEQDRMLLTESIDFSPQSVTAVGDGIYQLTARITGDGVPQLQASALTETLKGHYVSRANQVLQEDSRIRQAEITIQPNWLQWLFTRLPKNTDRTRINIRIDQRE